MSQFNFQLEHEKGSKMTVPDALSRRQDFFKGTEHDNKEVTMLPKEVFIQALDETLKLKLQSDKREKVITEALDAINTKGVAPMKTALKDWKEEDSIIFLKNKCYVPKIFEL